MLDPNFTTFQSFVSKAAAELGASSTFTHSESEIVDWMENENPPTTAALNSKITELKATYDAQIYARNRAADYPSQGDQNDMIYKDMLNSTTTHKDAVEAVKTKWPKNNTGPVE